MIGKFVIVRTYSAGVHYGTLKERTGTELVLTNARRVHYWEGAASLSQMAIDGIKKPEPSRVSVVVPEILVTEAIEVIPCTPEATENLTNQPIWAV